MSIKAALRIVDHQVKGLMTDIDYYEMEFRRIARAAPENRNELISELEGYHKSLLATTEQSLRDVMRIASDLEIDAEGLRPLAAALRTGEVNAIRQTFVDAITSLDLIRDRIGTHSDCGKTIQQKKKSGRPRAELTPEEKRVRDAWNTNHYKSKIELDHALGMDEGTCELILERLRKRAERRTK